MGNVYEIYTKILRDGSQAQMAAILPKDFQRPSISNILHEQKKNNSSYSTKSWSDFLVLDNRNHEFVLIFNSLNQFIIVLSNKYTSIFGTLFAG